MSRDNFFDLATDIPFDPVEQDADKIKKAIDKRVTSWKRTLNDHGATQSQKDKAKERLALENEMRSVMVPGTSLYIAETAAKKQVAIDEVKGRAELHKQAHKSTGATGDVEVPDKMLTAYVKPMGPSFATVKAAYESVDGISVVVFDVKNDLPPINDDIDIAAIERLINTLKGEESKRDTTTHPKSLPTRLEDLYDVAVYMGGNTNSRNATNASQIKGIFDSVPMSNKNLFADTLYKLSNEGKRRFANNNEKAKYDNWLKVDALKRLPSFKPFPGMPNDEKKNHAIADLFITELRRNGFTWPQAVALYNVSVAKLSEADYVIPTSPAVPLPPLPPKMICSVCGDEQEISRDAAKSRSCMDCGNSYYIDCFKCSKVFLRSLGNCPGCNYSQESARLFEPSLIKAKAALDRGDFRTAKSELQVAKDADPSRKKEADSLEQKINNDERDFRAKVAQIEKLRDENKLFAASKTVQELRDKYLSADLNAGFAKLASFIENKLTALDKLFGSGRGKTAEVREQDCVDILTECIDYSDAIRYLKANPPKPCVGIKVEARLGEIYVKWGKSESPGVQYTLVRSENMIPTKIGSDDSVVIKPNVDERDHKDHGIETGIKYGYAVFAVRCGVSSTGKGAMDMIKGEVNKLHPSTDDGLVSATWVLPDNCSGVRVFRKQSTAPAEYGSDGDIVKTDDCGFRDTGVKNGITYFYRVCSVYAGDVLSAGVSFKAIPDTPTSPPDISVETEMKKDGLHCTLTWSVDEKHSNSTVKIVKIKRDIALPPICGRVYSASDVSGFGKPIHPDVSAQSKMKHMVLPQETFHICVFVGSNDDYVASNIEIVSAQMPCKFRSKDPKIDGRIITFYLECPPEDATEILYAVSTTRTHPTNYKTAAIEPPLRPMTIETPCPPNDNGTYYITVKTSYDIASKKIESVPVTREFKLPQKVSNGIK
jgi:hypothetical protein